MNVSVVIPTLNESTVLQRTLSAVQRHRPHEIIVADGGSEDGTRAIAESYATKIVESPPGRARQMNAGAQAATGDLLLFLHADSEVDRDSYRKMVAVMAENGRVGGAFSLAIASEKMSLRLIARLATLRSRYLNLVYGDQAIFVKSSAFKELDGFRSLPICEDLDFYKRLKKKGPTVVLKEKARTSPRRWLTEGVWFTTLRNSVIAGLFLLGFSPRTLSKWYLVIR